MAGAGYKLFNTGDVLTAAQVNTYLMQQTVMVFADSSARTSALSGVLAEGMVSYLQDTNTLEVYDGSAWVGATGDITGLTAGTGISISSATGPVPTITNTVATEFDALGDLIVGTGADTFDRLPVGNSGETIVADSSASTGLRWQGNFAAGKNKVINGDFNINQRNFTSTTTTQTYGFDRWLLGTGDGTVTYSAETFTPGSAPVAGYEAKNFARVASTGQTQVFANSILVQRIESVRTLAGQTVTVSFWAKAGAGTPKVAVELQQIFGTGGSSAVFNYIGQVTLSTSWARYSLTYSIPSISGKTIGSANDTFVLALWTSAGSDFNARTGSLGIQTATIDFWGVQVEAGNVATAFQTATGTLAGELAACQRYYQRYTGGSIYSTYGTGYAYSTTNAVFPIKLAVTMRTEPTSLDVSNVAVSLYGTGVYGLSSVTMDSNHGSPDFVLLVANGATGLTANRPYDFASNNNTAGYIGFSAEL